MSGRAFGVGRGCGTDVAIAWRHRRWFRAPARCRPEVGVPGRPRGLFRWRCAVPRPSGRECRCEHGGPGCVVQWLATVRPVRSSRSPYAPVVAACFRPPRVRTPSRTPCCSECGLSVPVSAGQGDEDESRFLSRIRRLTVEGRRAGEGYFSPDGKEMVFQSEREPGNPFFQIYLLSLETGDVRRISPGRGRQPAASSRGTTATSSSLRRISIRDPSSCSRRRSRSGRSGQERRYAWDYDSFMDIFVERPFRWRNGASHGTPGDTTPREAGRRTANGSSSPRCGTCSSANFPSGKRVSPRSTRRTSPRSTSCGRMGASNGGSPRFRDTTAARSSFPTGPGSSGAAFSEDGLIADIWSMRPDGSDQRRMTDFGAMSWAPYVHPSGEYVLFASNKLGFSNFEVYMVEVAGEKEPVRITTTDGFDGLPVPTPEGTGLAWTSSRHGGAGGQIYLADWNHEEALAALRRGPGSRRRRGDTRMISRPIAHPPVRGSEGMIPCRVAAAGLASGLLLAALLPSPASGQTPEDLKTDVARAHRAGHRGPRGGDPRSGGRSPLPDVRTRSRGRPAAAGTGGARDSIPLHFRRGGPRILVARGGDTSGSGATRFAPFAFSETGEARGELFFGRLRHQPAGERGP